MQSTQLLLNHKRTFLVINLQTSPTSVKRSQTVPGFALVKSAKAVVPLLRRLRLRSVLYCQITGYEVLQQFPMNLIKNKGYHCRKPKLALCIYITYFGRRPTVARQDRHSICSWWDNILPRELLSNRNLYTEVMRTFDIRTKTCIFYRICKEIPIFWQNLRAWMK